MHFINDEKVAENDRSRLLDGGVRERPNRAVSKTAVSPGTVGSNPTSSASVKSEGKWDN